VDDAWKSQQSADMPNFGRDIGVVPSSAVTRIAHGLPAEPVLAVPKGLGGLPVLE
jgi:hypothetical protein